MNNKEKEILPDINLRIKKIIDDQFNGNVLKFSQYIGLSDSSRINRLFNTDKRFGRVPSPSLDIIKLIAIAMKCSTDSLIFGTENNTNNITIDNHKKVVNGNQNILTDSGDVNTSSNNSELLEIIKAQQIQINTLLTKLL